MALTWRLVGPATTPVVTAQIDPGIRVKAPPIREFVTCDRYAVLYIVMKTTTGIKDGEDAILRSKGPMARAIFCGE